MGLLLVGLLLVGCLRWVGIVWSWVFAADLLRIGDYWLGYYCCVLVVLIIARGIVAWCVGWVV